MNKRVRKGRMRAKKNKADIYSIDLLLEVAMAKLMTPKGLDYIEAVNDLLMQTRKNKSEVANGKTI